MLKQILGLILFFGLSSGLSAQIRVPIDESEVIGSVPGNPNGYCQETQRFYQGLYSGCFHVDSNKQIVFTPKVLGPVHDSLIVFIQYLPRTCPPWSGGRSCDGIGVTDSIVRVRPKRLSVGMLLDSIAMTYRGTTSLYVDNNTAGSITVSGCKIDGLPDSACKVSVIADSLKVNSVSLGPYERHKGLRIDFDYPVGPFWNASTLDGQLHFTIKSDIDSEYSNAIELQFPATSISNYFRLDAGSTTPNLLVAQQATFQAHIRSPRSSQLIGMNLPYPLQLKDTVRDDSGYTIEMICGPAAAWTNQTPIGLTYTWKTFSGKFESQLVNIPCNINIARRPILAPRFVHTGTDSIHTVEFRMPIDPRMRNFRWQVDPPLEITDIVRVPDTEIVRCVARPQHGDKFGGTLYVDYDFTNIAGNEDGDASSIYFSLEYDVDDWTKVSSIPFGTVHYMAAGLGSTLYLATDSNVYISRDEGQTFTLLHHFNDSISSLASDGLGDLAVVAGERCYTTSEGFRSYDFGSLYHDQNDVVHVHPAIPERVYYEDSTLVLRARWEDDPKAGVRGFGYFSLVPHGDASHDFLDKLDRLQVWIWGNDFYYFRAKSDSTNLSQFSVSPLPGPIASDIRDFDHRWMIIDSGRVLDWGGEWESTFGDTNVVDMANRGYKIIIATRDSGVYRTARGSFPLHKNYFGLEGLNISKVAQGDDVAYLLTEGNQLYRTLHDGEMASVGSKPVDRTIPVYPNPASTYVTLPAFSAKSLVTISDARGTIIFRASDIGRSIDVSSWANGVYTVCIATAGQMFVSRLVILR